MTLKTKSTSSFIVVLLWLASCFVFAAPPHAQVSEEPPLRGVVWAADALNDDVLRDASKGEVNAIVVMVSGHGGQPTQNERRAIALIEQHGFELNYWIEIARNESLANAHPEWMASLQGHQQWRRLHPGFPEVDKEAGEVVKNYPWLPVLYKEAYQAHLDRVRGLLGALPPARQVFLNDLQGAPSACGCGNTLCRWTADYGPIKTATALGDAAASMFVTEIGRLVPNSEVVPVWVTECEAHDGEQHGACAGVGCFDGICWKAYTRQLMPLVESSNRLGVLLLLRDFDRELPVFKEPAAWTRYALQTFQTMPPRRGGTSVDSARLIAVLQGWDVDEATLAAQISQAKAAGVDDYLIAKSKIEQQWKPQRFDPKAD